MLTVWPADDHAIVVLVAPHDRTASDVYAALTDALDVTIPEDERTRPPCCDDSGQPPTDKTLAREVVDAMRRMTRTRRRAR